VQEGLVDWLQEEYTVDLLPSGSVVLFGLDINKVPEEKRKHLVQIKNVRTGRTSPSWRSSWGTTATPASRDKDGVLLACHCRLLRLPGYTADSLNHAYTLISEMFLPTSAPEAEMSPSRLLRGRQWALGISGRPASGLSRPARAVSLLVALWTTIMPSEPEYRTPYDCARLEEESRHARRLVEEKDDAVVAYLRKNSRR